MITEIFDSVLLHQGYLSLSFYAPQRAILCTLTAPYAAIPAHSRTYDLTTHAKRSVSSQLRRQTNKVRGQSARIKAHPFSFLSRSSKSHPHILVNPKAFHTKSEKLISIWRQKGGSVTCGSFCVTGTEQGRGGMGVVLFPYPYQLSSVPLKSLSTTRLVSLLFDRSSTPSLYSLACLFIVA